MAAPHGSRRRLPPVGALRPKAPAWRSVAAFATDRRARVDPVLWPGLLVICLGLLLSVEDGGFGGHAWYPAGLFLLALLTLTYAVAPPHRAGPPKTIRFALVALAAFAGWALLSATWSDVPAMAWDGANRVILYMVVLTIVTLRPWPDSAFTAALGLVTVGLGAIALGVLIEGARSSDPASLFIGSRLSAPTGYVNATANLWLIGVWPAIALACGSRAPWYARAAALGVACLLLATSLMSASRGSLFAAVIGAMVLVALSRDRQKVLAGLILAGGCAALAAGPVLAVTDARTAHELDAALDPALVAIGWTSGLAIALAAAGILVSRRFGAGISIGRRVTWPGRNVRAAALLAALVASIAILSAHDPTRWTERRWQDFKSSGYTNVGTGSDRLTGSLGSGRYDFYRVALNQFADHPVVGIGYGNFQVPYLVHRRTDEAPLYTHSLPFGVISQVGLVGAALMLAFLGTVLAAVRRSLAADGGRRTLVAGAAAGFSVWFAHGMVDWLWEFPALGIVAFALLGLAARSGTSAAGPPAIRVCASKALRATAVLAALLVAASFATLGLAARLTRAALDEASRDPVSAAARLERAAELDPLAAAPLLTRGLLAQRLGDRSEAQRAFRRALQREPRNWFGHLQLGVTQADHGRRLSALQALARAKRLNPRQQVIDRVRFSVRSGKKVMPAAIERVLYEDLRGRLRTVPEG